MSQNNVLELWSLFDFLLPGFLGTERQFFERFGKPILLSRDAKSSSKEQEAGDTISVIIQSLDYCLLDPRCFIPCYMPMANTVKPEILALH